MDAHTVTHPTDQTLSSYGLGKLDDRATGAINKHLEECADCRKRVSEMSADSFLGRIRDAQNLAGHSVVGRSQPGVKKSYKGTDSPAPPSSNTLPPGLADHPDYEIKRELGRGGMGVVYLAHNTLMGRDEVLKVMGRDIMARPGVLDRFQREIRAVAKLRHPNIVTAYHASRIGESLVFAMEYVEGYDLAQLVKGRGPLPVALACNFVYQAALGLQHAHEEGLVHRDIKPGNLMLARKGEKATVKVLDFGLARATREQKVDTGLTSEGQTLGTPDFIAPEQILDAAGADIRADIYGLGGTLFYLLTGRPPFEGNSAYDVYQGHISRDAGPLNLIRPEVPVELASLVAKMMAKEPDRRFQTPGEVSEALAPFFRKGKVAFKSPRAVVSPTSKSTAEQMVSQAAPTPTQPTTDTAEPSLATQKVAEPNIADVRWESLIEIRETGSSTSFLAPATQPSSMSHPPRRLWLPVAATVLLAIFGAMWAADVFRVRTRNGTIELRNLPKDSEVFVDGTIVTVQWPGEGKPVRIEIPSGERRVKVTRGDEVLLAEEMTIVSGTSKTLTVRYESPPAAQQETKSPPSDMGSPTTISVSENGKAQETDDSVPSERDRRAAETALSLGGTVTIRVNGREQRIKPGVDLPTEGFQLTHVHLGDQLELTDAGLEAFEGLANLVELVVSKGPNVSDAGLAHLRNLPRLESLGLDNTGVSDFGLVNLKGLPTLKVLFLRGTGVTDAGLENMESLPQLNFLALGGSRVTDAGLVHLRGLTQLETLWLERTRLADAGLVHLRSLTKLRRLLLFGTQVTDAGLEHLQSLPQLELLWLGGRPVTDEGLAVVGSLKTLKNLWLDNTRVTDVGLVHLQGLMQLNYLNLSGTRVTDGGLARLHGLTQLKELHLRGTKVTAAGVARLKKSLPQCRLIADPLALEESLGTTVKTVPRTELVSPTNSQEFRPFNGKDFRGWNGFRFPNKEAVDPSEVFQIEGEDLVSDGRGGRIFLDRAFSNFSLTFEYLVSMNGQNGRVCSILQLEEGEPYGIGQADYRVSEVGCLLAESPAGKPGDIVTFEYESRNPGGFFAQRALDAASDPGKWNRVEIRCLGNVIQFYLNGRQVNQVDANRAVVCHPGFNCLGTGTRLRNLRITSLEKRPLAATNRKAGRSPRQKKAASTAPATNETKDALQPGTVWVGDQIRIHAGNQQSFPVTFTVSERNGGVFVARYDFVNAAREIHGTIKDGRIGWLAKDVRVIENHGNQGHDNFGTIEGEEISLSYSGVAATDGNLVSGTVKLHLQK